MKRLCLAAVVVTVFFGAVHADRGPQYRGMQVDAMGRSGTASIRGPSALYLNPAGLAGQQGYGGEASAEMGFNGVLLDYANWANQNSAYLNNIDSIAAYMDPTLDRKWAPYSSNYLVQGYFQDYAFSVVRDAHYAITFGKAAITPSVLGASMLSDLQISAGRGFVLPDDWKVGIAYKFLYRQRADAVLYGLNDDNYYDIKQAWQKSSSSFTGGLDKITVASDFAAAQYGFGVNLGASRTLPYGFTVAASVLDLPTFFNGGFFEPQLNLGGSYARDFGTIPAARGTDFVEDVSYNVLVNLDWQFPFPEDPWFKQWKGGVELGTRFHKHDLLSLSTGLNDGYPSFGVRAGYVLYAYYIYNAQETGDYPGQEKLNYHRFGLDLNF